MSNQKKSYDNLIFDDENDELQNLGYSKKNTKFQNRLNNPKNKSFENTWLNTVTEENRNKLKEELKQTVGNSKYKFKYLFQIPQIIKNSKLQSRKKTYEIFTKNSQLEQYNLQLQNSSSNTVNTIQTNAEYKDILSQISNNKVRDTYQHKNKKNSGVIFINELWSQKLSNQISDQSRLKQLSEMIEMNKIKMSYDEQLLNFQEYFTQKTSQKKETIADMQEIIKTAFQTEENQKETKIQNQNQFREYQNINLQSYFKTQDEQPIDYSTKFSRMASRNHSQAFRPKSQEYSIFSRRVSTLQKNQYEIMPTQIHHEDSSNDRLQFIIEDSFKENELTKNTVSKMNSFLKSEKEIQERIKKQRMKFYLAKNLNNAIKIKKQRESNSHIYGSVA